MLLKNKLNKLKNIIEDDNVLTTLEERYCYSKDASNVETGSKIPDLVVFVNDVEEVQKVMKKANEESIPIIPRGAGTNMVGACTCPLGGIVLNFSKMNNILDFNPINMTITVQPGVVLGDLKAYVEKAGLFFPPDPSNYKVSTVGGGIAQSSGGAKALKYGTIKDYLLSLKVVTADGRLLTLGASTIKDSVGYHLAQLMVGSEGTLAIVVEATFKLIPKPPVRKVLAAYFSDTKNTKEAVKLILASKTMPAALDFMDKNSINTVEDFMHLGLRTEYELLLLIELDGTILSVNEQFEKVLDILKNVGVEYVCVAENEEQAEKLWDARRSSYAAVTRLAPDVVSDDVIVPRDKIDCIIQKCFELRDKNHLKMCLVGHIGDGNLHPQIALDLKDEEQFKKYMDAKAELYNYVKDLGGSISAEHGVGIEKLSYLENTIDSNALEYMQIIKRAFDPKNILNPDKIFRIKK